MDILFFSKFGDIRTSFKGFRCNCANTQSDIFYTMVVLFPVKNASNSRNTTNLGQVRCRTLQVNNLSRELGAGRRDSNRRFSGGRAPRAGETRQFSGLRHESQSPHGCPHGSPRPKNSPRGVMSEEMTQGVL